MARCSSVSVQAKHAREQGVLVVDFGTIDFGLRGVWWEDLEQAESEVSRVTRILVDELPEDDVSTVAVRGVCGPAA